MLVVRGAESVVERRVFFLSFCVGNRSVLRVKMTFGIFFFNLLGDVIIIYIFVVSIVEKTDDLQIIVKSVFEAMRSTGSDRMIPSP